MDFGKAFTYVFDDPDWLKKIGIAGAIALGSMLLSIIIVGIAGFIVLAGWMLEIVRRVINRDPRPLPEWDDFGGYFSKGIKAFVVGLVYSLPLILVNVCIQIIPLIVAGGGDPSSDAAGAMAGGIAALSICLGCFSFIYSLLMAAVLPAAMGQLAVTGEMGSAFRFGEIIAMVRGNLGAYVMVVLGTLVAQIVASLGIIACGIGFAFTTAYAMAVQGHLYGQAYLASNRPAAPAPVPGSWQ
ncbi:MAG: DUF4013 domain-containing protein [Chloroflexota bacterium]